jgi:2-dehydropantoate 2-reductase
MTFFNKPNYIGVQEPSQQQLAQNIAEMLTEAGLETAIAGDIRKQVWEKVILNAALSPLCALTRLTMKAAMDFPPTFAIVVETLKEGIAVARADGYEFGADFLDFCIAYLRKAGHHKPSMLCDIEASRPTEIDYLSGAIVEYANKHSVSTPVNTTIAELVRGLEKAVTGADGSDPSPGSATASRLNTKRRMTHG